MRSFFGVLLAVLAPTTLAVAAEPAAKPHYNVLFIAVDDMRAELGCYGSPIVRSPHLDKLASESIRFNHAFAQQALCSPSRSSLLTGFRPQTIGINDLYTHARDRRPDVVTLPQFFKNNGYQSIGLGKIFHNAHQERWKGDDASWSVPAKMAYGGHDLDVPKVDGEVPPNLSKVPRTEMRDVPDEAYFDGRIANLAIDALRESKDRPFFLAVGFWKPHLPFNAPKKYWDLYDPKTITLPPNPKMPEGAPEIAHHPSKELLRSFPDGLTDEQTLTLRRGYYAAISYADAQVGKVLDELDRLGLRDKTIVVFWADHGFHLGEHDLWAKTSEFDLDARVPLLISVPGQTTRGQVAEAPVELLDLFPTILDYCNYPVPAELEGKSLRPIIENPKATVKPYAFTETTRPAYPKRGATATGMGYSLSDGRFRYTEWREIATGKLLGKELYDHTADPRETKNLAVGTPPPGVLATLAAALEKQFAIQEGKPLKYSPPPAIVAAEAPAPASE